MIRYYRNNYEEKEQFKWVDIVAPKETELDLISEEFSIDKSHLSNCLNLEQLPKFSQETNYCIIILRAFDETSLTGESIQHYTNRIIIFINENYIVTLHKQEEPCILQLIDNGKLKFKFERSFDILLKIVKFVILSFEKPLYENESYIDLVDINKSLSRSPVVMLNEMYYIRKFTSVMRRTLWKTDAIINSLYEILPERAKKMKAIKENSQRLHNLADELDLTAQNLISLHISLATHKSSEVMKTLTIFSIFFMPITFIVGVYGMNFEHMPELKWKYGYPAVLLLMVVVCLSMYIWLKRKGFIAEK